MAKQLILETEEGQFPVVWDKFLRDNPDLGPVEAQVIGFTLRQKGVYRGGGGAEAPWSLYYVEQSNGTK